LQWSIRTQPQICWAEADIQILLVFELNAFPERGFLFEVKEGKPAKRRRTSYVEHGAGAA